MTPTQSVSTQMPPAVQVSFVPHPPSTQTGTQAVPSHTVPLPHGPVSTVPSQLLSRPLHCDGPAGVSGTHVVVPDTPHWSWPSAHTPGIPVWHGCPAVGHMIAPPMTENFQSPGTAGVRFD
jgi:hypothetical protein